MEGVTSGVVVPSAGGCGQRVDGEELCVIAARNAA